MKTVGVFEAKTHFSALIEEARAGETIVVTKNGEPVAQIMPFEERRSERSEAMRRILSRRIPLDGLSIRELIEDGRRY
jgi:prevent-host-death family protein